MTKLLTITGPILEDSLSERVSAGRHRVALNLVVAAILAACSSGGGGGEPDDPVGPGGDQTPPARPVGAFVQASIPRDGVTTVTGLNGAVEANATVIVVNRATSTRAEVAASDRGAFSLQLPAVLGDPLSVIARDAAGNESPALDISAGPALSTLTVEIESGDGQVGVQGRPLVDPLTVRVRASGAPVFGLAVRFENLAADGALGATEVQTDPLGRARADYTLGPATGPKTVRAALVDGDERHVATFSLEAVGPPVIERVGPASVAPGEDITITGRNFSPIAAHDVVRIGGQAAAVQSATRSQIVATVPSGVTGSSIQVEVSLTGVSSGPTTIQLSTLPVAVPPVGQVTFAAAPTGSGTVQLPFSSGEELYLLGFESAAAIPAPFTLNLSATLPVSLSRAPTSVAPAAVGGRDPEAELLERGWRILERHGPAPPTIRALAPAAERAFWVANYVEERWEQRTARLEFEGPNVMVYVDNAVTPGDYPPAEARQLGEAFQRQVYSTIRTFYGKESDLDGNGKPIILLTPLVNILSDGEGAVLGFFMPADLADHEYSNRGEVFYLLAPDPTGRHGWQTPPATGMRSLLVGVAAHEFVHMIDANERLILRSLPFQDYWLEEGLAHFGEKVVGLLHFSNILGYLSYGTSGVSLVGDQLLTRGASTLFVARLVDRHSTAVLRKLVTGPGLGPVTVEAATGRTFGAVFHDWALALYNELYPIPGVTESFVTLNLGNAFSAEFGPPEGANALGRFGANVGDLATTSGQLGMRQGAVAYVLVGSEKRLVLGDVRYEAPPGAAMQVFRVRIR